MLPSSTTGTLTVETVTATTETVAATTETTAATTLTTATTTDLATTTVEETTTAPLTTDARTTTKNTEDTTADTGPIIYLLRRRRRHVDLDFDDYLDIGDEGHSAEAGVWDSQFWADTAELGPPRARREAATLDPSDYYYYDYDGDYYTEDDLDFILIEPVVVDGVVRVAVALDKPGETDVDADLLQSAAEAVRDSGQLESEVGMHVERIYRGLPQDPTPAPVTVSSAAWLDWRFLVAFFVIFVCFFIIVMVIMCIRRRRQPTVKAVDEDTLLPASAPVHQQQRPADKPNDASTPIINGRTHAPAGYHDDDGYIVPYDIMLDVFAHSYDGPQGPCESTKL